MRWAIFDFGVAVYDTISGIRNILRGEIEWGIVLLLLAMLMVIFGTWQLDMHNKKKARRSKDDNDRS